MPTDLITIRAAAALSGISKNTLKKACQSGNLPAEKPGQDWLFTLKDFEHWQANRPRLGRRRQKQEE